MTQKQATANQDNVLEITETQQKHQPSSREVTKESYGDSFQGHLLDQYKLYVEMADRISSRRGQTNSFYISLLSGWLAFLSISFNKNLFSGSQDLVFLVVASSGLALCFLWYINIRTYQRLNSSKFKVIHEIEKHLPFACYDLESEFLKKNKNNKEYLKLTNVERYIPLALSIPYLCLLIYSMRDLLK